LHSRLARRLLTTVAKGASSQFGRERKGRGGHRKKGVRKDGWTEKVGYNKRNGKGCNRAGHRKKRVGAEGGGKVVRKFEV